MSFSFTSSSLLFASQAHKNRWRIALLFFILFVVFLLVFQRFYSSIVINHMWFRRSWLRLEKCDVSRLLFTGKQFVFRDIMKSEFHFNDFNEPILNVAVWNLCGMIHCFILSSLLKNIQKIFQQTRAQMFWFFTIRVENAIIYTNNDLIFFFKNIVCQIPDGKFSSSTVYRWNYKAFSKNSNSF